VREKTGRTEERPVGVSRATLMFILWLPNLLFAGLLPSINTPSFTPSSLLFFFLIRAGGTLILLPSPH